MGTRSVRGRSPEGSRYVHQSSKAVVSRFVWNAVFHRDGQTAAMEDLVSGGRKVPGCTCCFEGFYGWEATGETRTGRGEDVQGGMLRGGKTAQKARQGLQHSNGVVPSKSSDAENREMNG